jgi:hypothetical protein
MTKTTLTSSLIADKKAAIAVLQREIVALRAVAKVVRADVKAYRVEKLNNKRIDREIKAFDRAQKKAARIAKLEAKLAAMKSPPVGALAIKAAKKPSKVIVTKMAA